MSRSQSLPQHGVGGPTIVEKVSIRCAWLLGAVLFVTVGWIACAPVDPLGVVSIWYHAFAPGMLIQALGLALIVSVAATFIAGRSLTDIGLFSACVGLVAVTVRGNTCDVMLFDAAEQSAVASLGLRLALECVAWCIVIMIAMVLTPIITQWSQGKEALTVTREFSPKKEVFWMSGCCLPGRLGKLTGLAGPDVDQWHQGKLHAATVLVVGLLIESLLLKGFSNRATEHGQSLFVVAGAVAAGAYVAYRLYPVQTPLWTISGAMKLAVLRYVIAWLFPGPLDAPILLNSSPMLRVLPLHATAGGVAAAIFMFWQMTSIPGQQFAESGKEPSRRHAKDKKSGKAG